MWLYNHEVLPVIYELGSLGASGDLAPLAHMSLSLIGEGEVTYKGNTRPTVEVFREFDIDPIKLHPKEGLALLNGTQFMSAYLSFCVTEGYKIFDSANAIASISIDALMGLISPFKANVNAVRNQKGQVDVAHIVLSLIHI